MNVAILILKRKKNKPLSEKEAKYIIEKIDINLIQTWIRNVLKIHIEICYDYEYDSTSYHYYLRKIDKEEGRVWKKDYATYEECLGEAIIEVLTNI